MNRKKMLRIAQENVKEAEAAWRLDIWNSGLRKKYLEAGEQLLSAERSLAAGEGRPHAIEWKTEGRWQGMIMSGAVVAGMFDCALILSSSDKFDVVIFRHTESFRFSSINDEVISGHPLHGSGLDPYGAFIVVNSEWIAAVRNNHSVHMQYDPDDWSTAKHYMLCLKDRIFEAITPKEVEWNTFETSEEALRFAQKLCIFE